MCGIAGVFNLENSQNYVQNILFAIQHRGQESCGIAARDPKGNIYSYKNMGLVKNVFTEKALERLSGNMAIGHVRYPTAGSNDIANAQPHSIELAEGPHMAVCANGDIINYAELRYMLENEHGFSFKSDNDGELIGRLIAFYHVIKKAPIAQAIARVQLELKGAFSAILMYKDRMFAFRDPHGFRPMVMGHVDHDTRSLLSDGVIISSESCGFGIVGAKLIREIEPGEIVELAKGQPVKTVAKNPGPKKHCVFELIYFSRPDSMTFGETVYAARERIGASLASHDDDIPAGDDLVVMPVPDSSNFMAVGYAKQKNVPFEMGLLRNHYVGRTFIKPNQKQRDEGVKQKFNPLPDYFPGKRVVLVDDSIVRGTTLRKIVRMLKSAGAKEVHVRIGSPRIIGSCYYGIDTPTKEELIANRMSIEESAAYLNADSLKHMQVDDFKTVLGEFNNFCFACFNLDYIYPPEDFEQKINVPANRC